METLKNNSQTDTQAMSGSEENEWEKVEVQRMRFLRSVSGVTRKIEYRVTRKIEYRVTRKIEYPTKQAEKNGEL
jgi:hypothetical protein